MRSLLAALLCLVAASHAMWCVVLFDFSKHDLESLLARPTVSMTGGGTVQVRDGKLVASEDTVLEFRDMDFDVAVKFSAEGPRLAPEDVTILGAEGVRGVARYENGFSDVVFPPVQGMGLRLRVPANAPLSRAILCREWDVPAPAPGQPPLLGSAGPGAGPQQPL